MSKETEKALKQMHKYMEGKHLETEEEYNKVIQEFIGKYNSGEIKLEETKENESDDLLFAAYDAVSQKEAITLAKKSLKLNPDNIDAENFITTFEEDIIKQLKKYEKTLKKAKEILEKENLFEEENIGCFYGILETRPYMRTKHSYMLTLQELGRYTEAMKQGEEMLRLCESDNLGIRYILLGIYVLLEKFEKAEELFKKYDERSAFTLFPMAILYYKKGDYQKTKKYLRMLEEENEDFLFELVDVIFNQERLFDSEEMTDNYYSHNSLQETLIVIKDYMYLLSNVPQFIPFILESGLVESE